MVQLDAALAKSLADGQDLEALQTLDAAKKDVDRISSFPCRQLMRLDLSQNQLQDCHGLEACVQLKWLSLAHNKLESLDGLESLQNLAVLNCSHNAVDSLAPVAGLSKLKALILNSNSIEEIGKLGRMPQLNTLVLSHNRIIDLGKSLAKLTQLAKLSLSHNQITSIGRALRSCTALAELRIAHNELTELPEDLECNSRVHIIDAGSNKITKWNQVNIIAKLRQLNNLNLRGNPLCEKPGYQDKVLPVCPKLRILDGRRLERGPKSASPEEDKSHSKETTQKTKPEEEESPRRKGASRTEPHEEHPQAKGKVKRKVEDADVSNEEGDGIGKKKVKGILKKPKEEAKPSSEEQVAKKRKADTSGGESFLDLIAPQKLLEDEEAPPGGSRRASKTKARLPKESGVVAIIDPLKDKKRRKRVEGLPAKGLGSVSSPAQTGDDIGLGGASSWT